MKPMVTVGPLRAPSPDAHAPCPVRARRAGRLLALWGGLRAVPATSGDIAPVRRPHPRPDGASPLLGRSRPCMSQQYSNCYSRGMEIAQLEHEARRADEESRRARVRLTCAVRRASREGLTQQEIARAVGRSQPEVSRLLHFAGTSTNGRVLRAHRTEVRGVLRAYGLRNVRVFGSTGRGEDGKDSDIDLLATPTRPLGLLTQARAEHELTELLGTPVDLVLDSNLRPDLRERILEEATPL
jgi:predicted nucleotidyltransferase